MAKVSPELLARCLEELREGRASIESILSEHSDSREELRSLLETALVIPSPPPVTPSASFRQHARAELLTHMAKEKRGWSSPARRLADAFTPRAPRLGLLLPLLLALLLGLGSFGGAAYAAQDSLPGDLLYPLKTGLETARVAVTFSESGKAELYLTQAAARLEELTVAEERGRANAIPGLSRAYANAVARAEAQVGRAAAAGEQIDALLTQMELELAQQQTALARAQSKAAPQALEALTTAADAAAQGQARAAEQRGPKPKTDGPPAAPQGQASPPLPGPSGAPETSGSLCLQEVDALDALISQLEGVGRKEQSLVSKLEAAKAALARCQPQAAQGQLGAFLNELNALRRACDVSATEYTDLFSTAGQVLTGPAGAPASALPATVAAPQCDVAPSQPGRPDSPGPPPGVPGPPDRNRP